MVLRNTILMGWMILREQNIKQAAEIALANEANVTDFNGSITFPWARVPKGVTIRRILESELFAVDIVVHQGRQERRTERERNDGRYDMLS